METFRKDDVQENHQNYRFLHKSRSDSVSIPVNSIELNSSGRSLLYRGSAGTSSQRATCDVIQRQERGDATNYNNQVRVNNEVKNKYLLKSGEMGMCRVPYCMICPTLCYYETPLTASSASQGLYHNNDGVQHGVAKAKIRKKLLLLKHFTFGIINPHAKAFQQWMLFFVISLFVSFIIDPFFYHLLSVKKDSRCIKIDWPMTITLVVLRSIADLIYLTNMLVQFRLAFIPFKSRYVGAPELIDHPRKIALHYLFGPFFLDLFIVLPIPQIISLFFLPKAIASSGANYTNNILRAVVLIQYVPRLYRYYMAFIPKVYESQIIPRIFFRNLMTLFISSHVAGSGWYLLGLQRLNQCLVDACHSWGITDCMKFMDCGNENDFHAFEGFYRWNDWKQNENSSVCFTEDGFPYGVYVKVINLTAQDSRITRYMYSFFWGFQQLSTLAGNLTPSYSVWEVIFSICITGAGLFIFALLLGNMQTFIQGVMRRLMERNAKEFEFELWMRRRRFPEDLQRKIRMSELFNWYATRGFNEEMLIDNLPEDLQRDVRRHIFKFVKKVKIFALMDEQTLDAICERLRKKTYIRGITILYEGWFVKKMVIVVRGKMESIGKDGNRVLLSEGDVCGEELLRWCPEEDARNNRQQGSFSNKTVKCLTNVEAFFIKATDIEEVINVLPRFFKNHRLQFSLRNTSPYWQSVAATTIQVAWRYRKKWLPGHTTHPSRFN